MTEKEDFVHDQERKESITKEIASREAGRERSCEVSEEVEERLRSERK